MLFVILSAWAIYALASLLFPGQRVGGLMAAVYFASHPALYTTVFQFSSLDNAHILFAVATAACYWMSLDRPFSQE